MDGFCSGENLGGFCSGVVVGSSDDTNLGGLREDGASCTGGLFSLKKHVIGVDF